MSFSKNANPFVIPFSLCRDSRKRVNEPTEPKEASKYGWIEQNLVSQIRNHLDTVLASTANDASKNKEASNYGWVEQNVVSKNRNVSEFVLESTANDESDNKD